MVAPMDTLSERMSRLDAAGWTAQFEVVEGLIACIRCEEAAPPSAYTVDEVHRFEGESDPADQAMLFALTSPCGHRGTLVTGFGAEVPATTAAAIAELQV